MSERASPTLDGSLSSIMSFQLNKEKNELCYKYNSSENVLKWSKEVTWKYNKEHSKKQRKRKKFKIRFIMILIVIVDYYWLFYVQFIFSSRYIQYA